MESAIRSNDLDAFSEQTAAEEIVKHLRNQMSLRMQDALRSYVTLPDPAKVQSRLAPYFEVRSSALASPASIFRELGTQLKEKNGELRIEFAGFSSARITWSTLEGLRSISLLRSGLSWKLSALDFPNAMPLFWDQPAVLRGTYFQSHFSNCCFDGKEKETSYNQLQLAGAVDIVDAFGGTGDEVTGDVTLVQIGAAPELLTGIKDGDAIDVRCKTLSEGNTGHYALPAYCDAAQIFRQTRIAAVH